MIIIHSSKFVNAEFEAEVGPIPLCMLPIGNRKMLELQVELFRKIFPNEKIVVTLPKEYQLTINEQMVINTLGVSVQRICETLDLTKAMLYVLNFEVDSPTEQVRILQGDQLLHDIPMENDCIAVASQSRQNDWYDKQYCHDSEPNWLGYFSFSSKVNLAKALALTNNGFSEAIAYYQQCITMEKVQPDNWFNCSHLNSYFNARSSITTQRSFNALIIDSGMVTKTSDHDVKIQAEIYWFSNLPPKLKRFTPQFIDSGRLQDGITTYYCLEFLPLLPLNELYVHGRNPIWFWRHIFELVKDYFSQATDQQYISYLDNEKIEESREDLYRKKTLGRLHTYQKSSQIDLDAAVFYQGVNLGSIVNMAQTCIDKTLNLPSRPVIMHGDLCFSNMLFDSRARMLKLIDPRGLDCHDNFSIFGDMTYDLAKLAHSVIGMYDFIIAGRFEILADDQFGHKGQTINFDTDARLERIQADFMQFRFVDGIELHDIMPAVVLLFLSMLPLHADRPDRQQAMLINAFRLYKQHVHQAHADHSIACNEQIYNNILEG